MKITDKQIRENLTGHLKSRDICNKLKIDDRSWRRIVNEYNDEYDKRDRLIISDSKGYELTTNKKLIKAYALRLIRHALSELNNAKKILQILKDKDQLKLIEEEVDLVDIAMSLGDKNGNR